MMKGSVLVLQPPLVFNFKQDSSQLFFALSMLLATFFIIPSAQAASCKVPKSYYKNVSCTSSAYFLAITDYGAPVALINSSGKKVVDLSRYQKVDADKISGGLLPVVRNNNVGYVDMEGREVIPATYDMLKDSQGWARPVSEGRIVTKKDGKYGVLSTSNQTIVPFSAGFSNIDDYRGGVARALKNKATSWLDKSGKVTSNPNASMQTTSNQGATNQGTSNPSVNSSSPTKQSNPSSFMTLRPDQQDGKWGFVDEENVTMITYSFDEVRGFSEGLAGIRVDNNWGFLNLGGELVIPFRFDNSGVIASERYKGEPAFVFKDGKAWIGNLQNGAKMCINKEGSSVACD